MECTLDTAYVLDSELKTQHSVHIPKPSKTSAKVLAVASMLARQEGLQYEVYSTMQWSFSVAQYLLSHHKNVVNLISETSQECLDVQRISNFKRQLLLYRRLEVDFEKFLLS